MRLIIIHLPPPEILEQIEEIRRPLNRLAGSSEALRYPPHITLRTGLVFPDHEARTVTRTFLDHAAGFPSFPVRTGPFVHVETGPDQMFLAWSVEPTAELMNYHRYLLQFTPWQKGPQNTYHPHLSLAYGDLTKAGAHKILGQIGLKGEHLPSFDWVIDHVALFEEKPFGWVEVARTALRG